MIELELWHWQLLAAIATAGIISVVIFAVYAIQRGIEQSVREIVYGKKGEQALQGLSDDEKEKLVYLYKYIRANERDAVLRYARRVK